MPAEPPSPLPPTVRKVPGSGASPAEPSPALGLSCSRCSRPVSLHGSAILCPSCGLRVEFAHALPDRYEKRRKLGEGGFGEVWLAFDRQLGREVALKFLLSASPDDLTRFKREARLAAQLSHPNIVALHDIGDRYLVMDFIPGVPADEVPLQPREAAGIVRQAAEAIAHAHAHGVIHRDLKPDNILVAGARAFVTDFGLAKSLGAESSLSLSGEILGTPAFMPPEQARGRLSQVGPLSDVYALGATLYALVAGRPPFLGKDVYDVLQRVIAEDPRPLRALRPEVDADLEVIVAKAMEKEPARRYAGAAELAADLARYLAGEPIAARPASLAYRARKRIARNPWAWAGLAASLLAVVAGVGIVITLSTKSARHRRALEVYQRAQPYYTGALVAALNGDDQAPELMARFTAAVEEAKHWDPAFDQGWFERAQFARLQGDEAEAWRLLEEGLWREPRHPIGLVERAMLRGARYRRDLTRMQFEDMLADADRARVEGREARTPPPEEVDRAHPELAELREAAERDAAAGVAGLSDLEPSWVRLMLAEIDLWHGRLDEARRRVEGLRFAASKVLLGRIEESSGNPAAAEELYADATVTDDHHWDAWEALATLRVRIGTERTARGDPAGFDLIAQGVEAWSRAVEGAPRRVSARIGRAQASILLGEMRAGRGEDPTPDYGRAIEDAAVAGEEDPAQISVRPLTANARMRRGQWRASRGEDPTEDFERAIRTTEEALTADPEFPNLHNNLGFTLECVGDWESRTGRDPTETYARAVESYDAALALDPLYANALANRANCRIRQAAWEAAHGRDPRALLRQAVAAYDAVLRLRPDGSFWNNRGNALNQIAEWEGAHGEDPTPSLREALESFSTAAALLPGYASAHRNRGDALDTLASRQAAHGMDPVDMYRAAIEAFDAALAINPQSADVYTNRASSYIGLGMWQAQNGEDPTESLRLAGESAEAAIARNPRQAEAHLNSGSARSTLGQWRDQRGEDPVEDYRFAIAAFDEALAVRPGFAAALANRGTAYRGLGVWQALHGEEFLASFEASLASFDAALTIHATDWATHANKGSLFMAWARWSEAAAAFDAALALRPGDPRLLYFRDDARRRAAEGTEF